MPLNEESTVQTLSKISEDALIRLVYTSSLTCASRIKPSIFRSVEKEARHYNLQHNITGILCYGNGRFFQCLEGKKEVLLPLVQDIFNDKQHKNVKILLLESIQDRGFSNWNMRLMFLERWLWSPKTKKQADGLSPYLPFRPENWNDETAKAFLSNLQQIETPPHVKESGITLNAFGHMVQHIAGPHQAFILVQSILGILVIIAITVLYYLHFA